jgi:predicted nucleic-acid-binding protein
MIGLDTNILVRQITRDDAKQTPVAEAILDRATESSLRVNLVVLAEIAWVLHRAYRYDNAAILAAIERILGGWEYSIEREELAREALANAHAANCGYADSLIELINREAGATATLTFDIRATRLPGMRDASSYR